MRGGLHLLKSCILAGVLSIGVTHLAVAQPVPEPVIEEEQAEGNDAPSRVARLSHYDGDVSVAPAGTEEWAEAVRNRPLTDGDRVWVERGGRAELQLGASSVHLDQGTGFSFVELSDDALLMELTEGAIVVHVRRKSDRERIEIDTPNAVVSLTRPGEYHIQVNEIGDETVVRTRSGASEIDGERQSYTLRAGEQGVFEGRGDLTANITPLNSRNAFESWANEREARDLRSKSSRYVSRDVIGYEDLDEHGDWVREPEYGYVWRPRYVVSGWAPYRDGRWVWVSPWGWTWVDAAPWGFAPFHYGRWAYVRSRWCWVPGPLHIRPIYAPALVGWIGGPHVSVSVSFGPGIGWFPLGPREVYVPGYWHSYRYIRNVNVSNTIIVNNTYITRVYEGRRRGDYRYRNHSNAVTAVHRDAFVSGGPVHGRYLRVDDRELRQWSHDTRPPAIAPQRESRLAARQVENRAVPRIEQRSREIAARRTTPARVSFDAERRAIESNGGRPIARSQLFAGRRSEANSGLTSRVENARIDGVRSGASTRPERDTGVRADRAGGRAESQREAGQSAAQPRALQDRPAWASQQSDKREEAQRRTLDTPNNEWRARRNEERTRESGAARNDLSAPRSSSGSTLSPMPSAPSVRGSDQREWRGREESRVNPGVIEQRQRDSSAIQRERSDSNARRYQSAPQPRIDTTPQPRSEPRQPDLPRAEPSSGERSSSERSMRSDGGGSRAEPHRSGGQREPRENRK